MAVSVGGGGDETPMSDINTTPLVDVMLVLLIIFMVTAPLITPSLIDLPTVGKAARAPDRVVQVLVGKDERLEVKDGDKTVPVTLRDIAPIVKQAQSGQPAGSVAVVIAADRNVKYETVVKVMDTLQRADVQRVGLSVQMQP